jgi:hypothetical protein
MVRPPDPVAQQVIRERDDAKRDYSFAVDGVKGLSAPGVFFVESDDEVEVRWITEGGGEFLVPTLHELTSSLRKQAFVLVRVSDQHSVSIYPIARLRGVWKTVAP